MNCDEKDGGPKGKAWVFTTASGRKVATRDESVSKVAIANVCNPGDESKPVDLEVDRSDNPNLLKLISVMAADDVPT